MNEQVRKIMGYVWILIAILYPAMVFHSYFPFSSKIAVMGDVIALLVVIFSLGAIFIMRKRDIRLIKEERAKRKGE